MKNVDWGILHNKYSKVIPTNKDEKANTLFKYINELSNPKGIYEAVLSGEMKYIQTRKFDKKDTNKKYNEQKGICPYCHGYFESDQMYYSLVKGRNNRIFEITNTLSGM